MRREYQLPPTGLLFRNLGYDYLNHYRMYTPLNLVNEICLILDEDAVNERNVINNPYCSVGFTFQRHLTIIPGDVNMYRLHHFEKTFSVLIYN